MIGTASEAADHKDMNQATRLTTSAQIKSGSDNYIPGNSGSHNILIGEYLFAGHIYVTNNSIAALSDGVGRSNGNNSQLTADSSQIRSLPLFWIPTDFPRCHDSVIDKLDDLIKLPDRVPSNHVAWYKRGLAYLCIDSLAEAITSFGVVLTLMPEFAPAMGFLGVAIICTDSVLATGMPRPFRDSYYVDEIPFHSPLPLDSVKYALDLLDAADDLSDDTSSAESVKDQVITNLMEREPALALANITFPIWFGEGVTYENALDVVTAELSADSTNPVLWWKLALVRALTSTGPERPGLKGAVDSAFHYLPEAGEAEYHYMMSLASACAGEWKGAINHSDIAVILDPEYTEAAELRNAIRSSSEEPN